VTIRRISAGVALAALLAMAGADASPDATTKEYVPGVTVEADEESPTRYTATFVYEPADPGVSKVVLYSDTFLLWDEDAPRYENGTGLNLNSVSAADRERYGHLPQDYASTRWPGGGSASSRLAVELDHVADEGVWVTELPLMSGAFVYNYEVTANGVTTSRLDDPANPALVNTATGVRSLSSLVYVPYDERQGTEPHRDRSLELPRTDGRTGRVETITYPALDGTQQRGMSVYLPHGYDADRAEPYPVLYINMGNSGDRFGNELRWMNEGALPHIVDNLVAQGKEPFVAVSMNYQDWSHDSARIEPDVLEHVLPFVEESYNVSAEREGRGYAGLSMGAATTARFYLNHPDVFSQYGIWSNGVQPTEAQIAEIAEYADSTRVHIGLGAWDFVTAGRDMSAALTAHGIPHAFTEIPGGHDWELWQLMLADFAENHLWEPIIDTPVTAALERRGGAVFLPVSVTNEDSVAVDLVIRTPHGDKTFVNVKPGRTVTHPFRVGALEAPAGAVTVTATGVRDGEPVSWVTTARYAALPAG